MKHANGVHRGPLDLVSLASGQPGPEVLRDLLRDVILLGGLCEGLVYLGLPLPAGSAAMSQDHGELMVLGFLGTLIALERAVALGKTWGYLARDLPR